MRLRIAPDQAAKIATALARAGTREIGGQMFGEQLAPSDFRVSELTVQKRGGAFARFVVDVVQAMKDARRFFDRTKHDYRRFNYIGEWHSHPSFAVEPSVTDATTMRKLVADAEFRGAFAVLMIVRLDGDKITRGAWLFDPRGGERLVTLEFEHDDRKTDNDRREGDGRGQRIRWI
ncbi:hypothetical protein U91I_03437 [alpha proteobacterium U9-1i]|nr:hypothetical protein U91I_03437 [alpha proteobacterium U9-1i]